MTTILFWEKYKSDETDKTHPIYLHNELKYYLP
jgi:hypothetical protein